MESKHIYGSTYITQTRNKGKVLYSGTPDEILLEAISPFNPQFAVHMPCQILSLSHYCFSSGFSMSSQNVGMYDLIYLYKGSVKVNYPVNNFIVNAKEFLFLNTDSRYTIEQFGTETLDILIIRNYGFICQSYYTLFLSQNIKHLK